MNHVRTDPSQSHQPRSLSLCTYQSQSHLTSTGRSNGDSDRDQNEPAVIRPRKRRRRYIANNDHARTLIEELNELGDELLMPSPSTSIPVQRKRDVWEGHVGDNNDTTSISGLHETVHYASNPRRILGRPESVEAVEGSTSERNADSAQIYQEIETTNSMSPIALQRNGAIALGGRELVKLQEARKFGELLLTLEMGKVSENVSRNLLRLDVVGARNSYDTLMRYIKERARISRHYLIMCPERHAAVPSDTPAESSCPYLKCAKRISSQYRYWFRTVSEQLSALCREESAFQELLSGCRRAQHAMTDDLPTTLYDFYDGALFRRRYKERIKNWDEDSEMFIFLTMSTDGFQLFKGRKGHRSAWPVLFIILTLCPTIRYRAMNALVASFIPASHAQGHFDSFLNPIIDDLASLEEGINVLCYDGRIRKLRAFVLFFTSDWPAASKVLGFVGHNGIRACRMCWKEANAPNCGKARYLLPNKIMSSQSRAVGTVHEREQCRVEQECGEKRSDTQTRKIWKKLEGIRRKRGRGWKKKLKDAIKETGVKPRTSLARLSLDMCNAVPYDPMHQLLLGWISLTVELLLGEHKLETCDETSYVLSSVAISRINEALLQGVHGIPQAWGRPPESFAARQNFKAEDFKNIGLFYGPVIFRGNGVDTRVTPLWGYLSRILHIVLDPDPTPCREDIEALRSLLSSGYELYRDIFNTDSNHNFCMSPNTHAVLHFSEILRECGPLLNVSQFVVERFIGEVGSMIRSSRHPETSLFNKTHSLFCLRLVNSGIALECRNVEDTVDEAYDSEDDDEPPVAVDESLISFRGRGVTVTGVTCEQQAQTCISGFFPEWAKDISVLQVRKHDTVKVGQVEYQFTVESKSNFDKRCRTGVKARQKCWIAAYFLEDQVEDKESFSDEDETYGVYYGCINELWDVSFSFLDSRSGLKTEENIGLVRVHWQNGLALDHQTDFVFTATKGRRKRGTIRDTQVTVELVSCIQRVIGYLDYQGRRYFLDPERTRIEKDPKLEMRGLHRASRR